MGMLENRTKKVDLWSFYTVHKESEACDVELMIPSMEMTEYREVLSRVITEVSSSSEMNYVGMYNGPRYFQI